ncbi:MAG: AAA family ATPase [Sulfobacillus sp.]
MSEMRDETTVVFALPRRADLDALRAMLGAEVKVLGEATSFREATALITRHRPEVALVSSQLPDGDVSSWLEQDSPLGQTKLIVMATDPQPEDYRTAMRIGALDLLPMPLNPGSILESLRRVAKGSGERQGKIVTVFATKGGVGKTTIAANVAAELAGRRQRVCVVDLDLEFGSLSAFFGAVPEQTMADLVRRRGAFSLPLIQEMMVTDPILGVPILASPLTPDLAPTVDGEGKKEVGRNYVAEILRMLCLGYDTVVVDTASRFSEATVTALEMASTVLLVTAPDVPALQSTAKGLTVLVDKLGFQPDRLKLILNRANAAIGLTAEDISRFLDYPISYRLPSDGDAAVRACNTGVPIVRRRRSGPLARALAALAQEVAGPPQRLTPRRSVLRPLGVRR